MAASDAQRTFALGQSDLRADAGVGVRFLSAGRRAPLEGSTLVCTLGSQPQVVTLALELLPGQGRPIAELVVVHTAMAVEPVRSARGQLEAALAAWPRLPRRFVVVSEGDEPAADLSTPDQAAAFLRTLYREVLALKQAGRRVDLNLSGGRKPMSIYAMVVAQLLFDAGDRLWYLLSGDELRRSGQMRLRPGDTATLLEVPVLRWSSVSPVATPLGQFADPWDAIRYQQEHHLRADLARKHEFAARWLSPAERDLARLAATTGLDNAGLAERLGKSVKTVNNQLTAIYAKLHEFLGFRAAIPTDRAVLAAELGPYFALGEIKADDRRVVGA
jgi:CRISPR-associated protein Csx14